MNLLSELNQLIALTKKHLSSLPQKTKVDCALERLSSYQKINPLKPFLEEKPVAKEKITPLSKPAPLTSSTHQLSPKKNHFHQKTHTVASLKKKKETIDKNTFLVSSLEKKNIKENATSKKKTSSPFSKEFELHPKPCQPEDLFAMMEKLKKHFPKTAFIEKIPPDDKAKKTLSKKSQTQNKKAVILIFSNDIQERNFLQKVGLAINKYLPCQILKAKIIEKNNGWQDFLNPEKISFILANKEKIFSCSHLKKFYVSNDDQTSYLRKIPIIALEPTSSYEKNPQKKKILWDTILYFLKAKPLKQNNE